MIIVIVSLMVAAIVDTAVLHNPWLALFEVTGAGLAAWIAGRTGSW